MSCGCCRKQDLYVVVVAAVFALCGCYCRYYFFWLLLYVLCLVADDDSLVSCARVVVLHRVVVVVVVVVVVAGHVSCSCYRKLLSQCSML